MREGGGGATKKLSYLVTKEVDVGETLGSNVLQRVCLVPTCGEKKEQQRHDHQQAVRTRTHTNDSPKSSSNIKTLNAPWGNCEIRQRDLRASGIRNQGTGQSAFPSSSVILLDITHRALKSAIRRSTYDIEADLASYRVGESVVGELGLESLNKLGSQTVLLVKGLKLVSLLNPIRTPSQLRGKEGGGKSSERNVERC